MSRYEVLPMSQAADRYMRYNHVPERLACGEGFQRLETSDTF